MLEQPWGISPLLYLISLELIEEEKVLLSSSLDRTVHLWSTDGEYFGKDRPTWPAAQSRFRASGGASIGSWILRGQVYYLKRPLTLSPEDAILEVKEDTRGWDAFCSDRATSQVLSLELRGCHYCPPSCLRQDHLAVPPTGVQCSPCDLLRGWAGGQGLGLPKLGVSGVPPSPCTVAWVLQRSRASEYCLSLQFCEEFCSPDPDTRLPESQSPRQL
ncbi:hypothetical protein J1605_007203 [Eschrichtius robustus]|uniref:Uncharacterized protein n=1 Tax=Eschrichtius robustus TaxID=9764 RepID=A0AB34GYM6_ESCRO|nr:hypothetical protein J1605_007203 [Eschrichtius robustus]